MPIEDRPLWTCPKCGKMFVTKNLWHSCVRYTVDQFFEGKNPRLRLLYETYVEFVERICGKIIINVDKTRISFQTRTRFAGITGTTKDTLIAGFWLKHEIDSPRFTRVEFIPPNNYVYQFRIKTEADMDEEVAAWIDEAFRNGQQQYS